MKVISLLDSIGDRILDSVSADYEDSFCLDTFAELIAAHDAAEPKGTKCFIIARVQTWDHKQPDKAFYSYYNAYHLNKIMFQTQVYFHKKLIHRLHVLNPLTNTDIIGNVQYFMVKGRPKSNSTILSRKTRRELSDQSDTLQKQPAMSRLSSPPKSKESATAKPKMRIQTDLHPSEALTTDLPPASPSVKSIEKGDVNSWTIASPTVAQIQEEDEDADENKAPKAPTNTPASATNTASLRSILRRISTISAFAPYRPQKSKSTPPTPRNPSPNTLESGKASTTVNALISPAKFHPQMDFSGIQPTSVLTGAKGVSNLRVAIPEGCVTRFAQPVSSSNSLLPETHKNRRRTLSYVNAVTASGMPASIEEWIQMVKEESEQQIHDYTDYDRVTPFGSPLKTGMEYQQGDPCETDTDTEFTAYDAVLFGTDNDFLEDSKIRRIFKDNAVSADEAVLFEMTPVTSEPPESPVSPNHRRRDHDDDDEESPCEWCFPGEEQLRKYGPISRFIHRFKCYGMMVVFIVMIALL
ncbi:hypothetical protein BJ741DRAFT_612899 [Chytriomyces cf. hyalinus JEL632]|nr:hypothetical protein BJ741DRAFT_612899 [Chytriomyces cf. hyalinus JEL632]